MEFLGDTWCIISMRIYSIVLDMQRVHKRFSLIYEIFLPVYVRVGMKWGIPRDSLVEN
jgi:hypothetical protein